MNRSANEFECDTLGFLFHKIMPSVYFRLHHLLQETSNSLGSLFSGHHNEYCLDRLLILFNSRIYVCECPVEVNCP